MPPKKNLFKDVVVVLAGSFPGYKQGRFPLHRGCFGSIRAHYRYFGTTADLKSLVEGQGAKFSSSVTDDCTHLVTTQREVDKKNSKYKQACKVYTCDIVSIDWLLDSTEKKIPLPAKTYLLGSGNDDAKIDGKQEQEEPADKKEKKKRTLEEALHISEDKSNKKPKDGQKLNPKTLNVPVDEKCHLPGYAVYIDPAGLIWDATLNQTVAAKNNNKFYRIQLLVDKTGSNFRTWTRWGRVGETGQYALLGGGALDDAQYEFQSKFKSKSGLSWDNRLDAPKKGKYTFIERNYEEDSEDENEDNGQSSAKKSKDEKPKIESQLPAPVQDLMSFIFNQSHFLSVMASMDYDAQKLPLGKLSKRTLRQGFLKLKELSELIADPNLAATQYGTSYIAASEELSNQYFTVIPHVFGRNRPPVLNSDQHIKKEIELLEALTDMEVANGIMKESKDADTIHQLDRQFQSLKMQEMTPLEHNSDEFILLEHYLHLSRGSTHRLYYQVVNIFRIERDGEDDRFNSSQYGKLSNSNRRLLWHGSRSTNFGGILSQGLRIAPPEAPVTGYMFGKGVYFADMSSKSANYCCSHSSGDMGLLLLCDVELGNPMLELDYSNYNAGDDAKKDGKIATLGRGGTVPAAWKDAGCVHPQLQGVIMPDVSASFTNGPSNSLMYNEYIVYDVAQIRQKYLFQVYMR
ncbi:poly polymerase catalytic domain-containing protein [Aspergillus coremiiformis]|uniref:Poly [ADP-ribose] polymerase n=1 Tax=Aspergillus coremiiformis TaxID=138285 RepID=A0A5N6Z2I1_9EURO|nr:poly polymerase catalytic domain-containing protein [Aspergillus coremiiformis]